MFFFLPKNLIIYKVQSTEIDSMTNKILYDGSFIYHGIGLDMVVNRPVVVMKNKCSK